MPTPTKGPRLGGGPAHEKLIIANLARALFSEGRIRTTEAKAKRLRPQAGRLITFAKRGDVASRRQVLTVVRDKAVVHTLFAEIAPRFADRQGGYTRILKLGPRPGDGAPMALIELVEQGDGERPSGEAEDGGGPRPRFGRRGAGAEDDEAEDEDEDDAEAEAEDEVQAAAAEAPSGEADTAVEPGVTESGVDESEPAAAQADDDAAETTEDEDQDRK